MRAQTEGACRSALTFVPSQEPTESVRFDRLRRVREPVSRSKAGVQGKVADVISGRSRHAESLNELQGFRVLQATAHADSWQEQPFVLVYHHEGKKHRYTPDLLVVWGTHREAVEIKEDAHAELPENQKRFALIRELLGEHGYHFRLWKKSEICAEPRLTNVKLVLRYRSVQVSAVERERIRRSFSTTPGGRCRGLHFGVDDYTAASNITAEFQTMDHPACDFARHVLQICSAGRGVELSDGATNIMPVGPHKQGPKGPPLGKRQREENRAVVHRAMRLHFEHVQRSLRHAYYQGWDLHPA